MEKFSKLETRVSGYWSGKCDSLHRRHRSLVLTEVTQLKR
jgi:Txe/YoeB family toxin of Txe-Axe toxin-antitoxin module